MGKIVKPASLQPGDKIWLISPSEPITKDELNKIARYFEKLGYQPVFGKNILAHNGDYAAGTGKERAEDINQAFADKETKAIISTVGGLVALETLEHVDFDLVKNQPKIFAGYSDTTTLQLAFLAKTGLVTFHSPNAAALPDLRPKGYTMSNFWKMLGSNDVGPIKPQSVWQTVRHGKAEGVLFGGNLSCLCKLLGTKFDPIANLDKWFDKDEKFIFFWEEVYEQFSEIMRNLWQLRNTGFFERVAGMVVGKLTAVAEIDYSDFPPKKELLKAVTAPFDFPIIYGFDFGHEVPKATVPIGVKARIDTSANLLEILESAVV